MKILQGFFENDCVWYKKRCWHKSEVTEAQYNAAKMDNVWYKADVEADTAKEEEAGKEFESVLANLHLEDIDCIPKVCEEEVHFYNITDWPKPPAHHDRRIFLPSLPGSGNTWTRSVIREGTRVWTGAVYWDRAIYNKGYLGEKVKNPKWQVSAVKTHWSAFGTRGKLRMSMEAPLGAIFVIRSPVDAFVSEFNRQQGGGHTASAKVKAYEKTFPRWINRVGSRTIDMVRRWTRGDLEGVASNEMPIFTTREVATAGFVGAKTDVMTIYYEDMVRDFVPAAAKIFWFIKRFMGDSVPPVRDSVICALRGLAKEEKFHRKSKGHKFNPFTELHNSSALGELYCDIWKGIWNEEKWGKCTGAYQDFSNKVPKPSLPENICE